MINRNLLLAELQKAGYTQRSFCKAYPEFKPNTLNAKINGKAQFTCDEAQQICDALQITDSDTRRLIFLP